jgi:hypothetical protein
LIESCVWLENGKCKFFRGNHKCGVSHWKSCARYLNRKRVVKGGRDEER